MPKVKALVQVVAEMNFEELEAASAAEDALLVAFVKGGQPLRFPLKVLKTGSPASHRDMCSPQSPAERALSALSW